MAKPTRQARFGNYGSFTTRTEPPKKKRRAGLYAVGVLGLVIFSAIWNPPTGSVHNFTEASDYRADRESGCTNSGEGCHGEETTYRSFNDYHPNAECTSCHEYQGVGCIPCHSPKNHECQVCHDGSMPQAPDRVKLSDPYPRGHYRESTHTAMATPFDAKVRAAEGGEAQATCKSCHARDLAGAHLGLNADEDSEYGSEIGCGECHNDKLSFGLEQVLGDWKERSCESCHREGSSTPMHATDVASEATGTSEAGCGDTGSGCHEDYDLHALHPDRPVDCSGSGEGDEACHDLEVQSAPVKTRSCASGDGSCHPAYRNDDYTHEKDAEVHSPEGTVAAADASYFGTACGDCHWLEPDGQSLVGEHLRATSSRSGGTNVCRGCHNHEASKTAIENDWPNRDNASACSDCHGNAGLDPVHGEDVDGVHRAEDSRGCADSGAGCHPTSDLFAVGANGLHESCLRCHDATPSDGNRAWDPSAKSCGESRACHSAEGEYDPATSVHAGAKRVDGRDAKHRASAAFAQGTISDFASGLVGQCGDCHSGQLGTEHDRVSNSIAPGNTCTACHNSDARASRAVKRDWPRSGRADACEDCHSADTIAVRHGSLATRHKGVELSPTGQPVQGACATSGCHATSELLVLHEHSGGCTTPGCHGVTGDIMGKDTRTCGGPEGGGACHAGYSALGGHSKVSMSHIGLELTLTGEPQIGACSRDGCHVTVDLKRLHDAEGCGNEGCHKPGSLLQTKSCGGSDPNTACHAGFTESEHFVDHSAALSGTVNGVEYALASNVGCFGCHFSDLTVEHSATVSAPIAGGGESNCRVCHDDQEDPGNGEYAALPAVKNAIANGDRRCVACHASGTDAPDSESVASPHKRESDSAKLTPGYVWADPFSEWRTAFSAPIGGGHNVLTGPLVGSATTKLFPLVSYEHEGTTYTWELPANSGDTTWLDTSAIGAGDAQDLSDIQHLTITCDDCHVLGDMSGPHGSAVPIAIDPEYSQTEYANPSRGLSSQFDATGTDRVICMKCHTISTGSVEETTAPGGAPVHAQHARHNGAPATHPLRYGEKCVDCHVRVPHAWRSPRLLARTIPSEGRPADEFPYVSENHEGLAGIRLRDIDSSAPLTRADCATGGCHGYHDASNHPEASDIPAATFWP